MVHLTQFVIIFNAFIGFSSYVLVAQLVQWCKLLAVTQILGCTFRQEADDNSRAKNQYAQIMNKNAELANQLENK